MSSTDTTIAPEVWIGSFAAYSAGHLIGQWFDATDAPEDSAEWLAALDERQRDQAVSVALTDGFGQSAADFHEEIHCFDHQGFAGWITGECSPSEAKRVATLMAEIADDPRGESMVHAVRAWMDHTGEKVTEWDRATEMSFDDAYAGEWESEGDYAADFAEEFYFAQIRAEMSSGYMGQGATSLVTTLEMYFDHAAFARDLFMDGYSSTPNPDGGVFVFRDC